MRVPLAARWREDLAVNFRMQARRVPPNCRVYDKQAVFTRKLFEIVPPDAGWREDLAVNCGVLVGRVPPNCRD